jgi:hypothetical protein
VEGIIPAAPPVSPLKSISPTQFVSLRECALKGVWGANRVPPLLPPAPAARLGSVIHQLLEEAGEGRFVSGDRSGIDHRWQELISESHTAMRGSWLERHFVPLSASVHDFEVRRIQAIERAQEVAAGRAVAPEPPREIGERAPYGYELPVSTSDGLVRGQIDAVLCSETGPLIRDYKSGAIFDTRSKGALVVKAAYEVQLQLYAGLYAEATGTWPARLEVVPVLGGPVPVPFERSACTALLNEARAELERTNNTIKRHDSSPLQLQQILASPDASACGSCLYRPACTPYREATSAGQGWPNDLWGRVGEIRKLGNERLMITLGRPAVSPARVRGLSADPSRHPALKEVHAGEEIGLFNLKATTSPDAFAESAFTVVYRFPESRGSAPRGPTTGRGALA